jgi:hypothetical protein
MQEEFQEIILSKFLERDVFDIVMKNNMTEHSAAELDARRILNKYIYDIIEDGKNAEYILEREEEK